MKKTGKPHLELSAEEIEELRHARNIVAAAIHPDTGKPLPIPLRITFFMPANIPISMGFLFAPPTMQHTIFWQVVNQSYNAEMNFGNANKSSPATSSDIAKSYMMAVTASVGSAIGVRLLLKNLTASATGGKLVVLNAIVSTIACACGGFANNWSMRQPELRQGIKVQDPANDEFVGSSVKAAESAIMQTASSRILMALPVGLPGFAVYALERKGLYPNNIVPRTIMQLSLISAQLLCAVPVSMGAFP